jgi:DNA invertase Pin-like site-specific DNA recombinase
MERQEDEVLSVLLRRLWEQELISESQYHSARDVLERDGSRENKPGRWAALDIRKIRETMTGGRSVYDIPMRVTFYARVSTDKTEQIGSLGNQVQYYTDLIKGSANWTYVEGYIDEGVSGTDTKRRDGFLRMIADAKAGLFDFIITKEISRFSRSTLDSIRYTQELLARGVGVLFQNDNINTLDPDSEFRLVVMAGVAQDEVRKLSERLKFGFRQSIKNGRVLGNGAIWGYDKQNGRLTINESEAEAVRLIFGLYADQKLGFRRISQALTARGHLSRNGTAFNTVTIRHILLNPKYKGWYCGTRPAPSTTAARKRSFWICENGFAIRTRTFPPLYRRSFGSAHTPYTGCAARSGSRIRTPSKTGMPTAGRLSVKSTGRRITGRF